MLEVRKKIIPQTYTGTCRGCPHEKTCCRISTEVDYVKETNDIDILFIGQGGGKEEDVFINPKNKDKCPFVGRAGKYLRSIILNIWNTKRLFNVAFSNTVRCHPVDENGKDRIPTSNELKYCLPNVIDIILALQPKVIIPLGKSAITSFFPHLEHESMGRIRSHERILELPSNLDLKYTVFRWISTYHPSFLVRQYGSYDPNKKELYNMRFEDDLAKALELCSNFSKF